MRNAFASLGLVCALCAGVGYPESQEAEPRLMFEVASIKPSVSVDNGMSINRAAGGALNATNVSVSMLISFAYDLRDYQILNAPGWAATDRFDIVAKPEASEGAKDGTGTSPESQGHLRQRTRALLEDRFGLKTHIESREMSIYALVVAKSGPRFSETKPENRSTFGAQISSNNTRVRCKQVTMLRFAQVVLADRMGRTVLDRTGLTGDYDFEMTFVPDEAPPKAGAYGAASEPAGPTFLTALQEQLGLRLEQTKGPVEFLNIDRVEKPSAN